MRRAFTRVYSFLLAFPCVKSYKHYCSKSARPNGTTYAHVLEELEVGADKGDTEKGEVGTCCIVFCGGASEKQDGGSAQRLARTRKTRTVVVLAVAAEVDGHLFGLRCGRLVVRLG